MLRTRTRSSRTTTLLITAAAFACALAVALAAGAPPAGAAAAERLPAAAELDAYLSTKGSPMAGQGAAFVASGGRWKVDPRLLIAIAGAESSFGQITCERYNAWGWGCPNNPYGFSSWADAIETITRGLRTGYLAEGRTSVVLIQQKYAPSGAANDPTGLNNHWVANVSQFLLELGGNPHDVDLDGVAGSMPLGVEVDASAPTYDFAPAELPAERDVELVVRAGETSRTEIAVENSGSQVWAARDVRLRRVDVNPRLASAQVAALTDAPVEPGESASFAIDLAAVGSRGGVFTTLWRLEGPSGAFGPEIERQVRVEVPSFVAGAAQVRAPAQVAPGARATVVVKVQNAGREAWSRDGEGAVALGARTASGPPLVTGEWVSPQVPARLLERTVEPGAWGSFAFPVAMPIGASAPAKLELVPFTGDVWASGAPAVLEIAPG